MFNRKSHALKGFILLAIIIGIVLVNGCGKLSPTGPENDQAIQKEAFGTQDIEAQWGKVFNLTFLITSEDIVQVDGDTVDICGLGYKSTFVVPDSALTTATNITCTPSRYVTASGAVYIYDFGPEGLKFNKSCDLGIEIAAMEKYNPNPAAPFSSFKLFWWNAKTSSWELQQIDSDLLDGTADFKIDHFSRYGISGE